MKLGKEASRFSIEDRVGLISDAATLAQAGYAKTSGTLSLVNELGRIETEYLPWSQIATALSKLIGTWWEQPESVCKALDTVETSLFRPIVDKMGYDHGPNDAPDVKELRTLAISTCAAAEDSDVLAEFKRRFAPFLSSNDDSQITPDLQRSIYVNAVRHGSVQEYEKILEVYNKPHNPSTKVDAMYALCSTRVDELLDRTFKMFSDGTVKTQDLYLLAVSEKLLCDRQDSFASSLDLRRIRCPGKGMRLGSWTTTMR